MTIWNRVGRWVRVALGLTRRVAVGGAHAGTAFALSLTLGLLAAPWIHPDLSPLVGQVTGLHNRAAWIVTGGGLLAGVLTVALTIALLTFCVASLRELRARWLIAGMAVMVAVLAVPWKPLAGLILPALDGHRPSLTQVEAILPAGPFALPVDLVDPLVWPVRQTAQVTSRFGWRDHPVLGGRRFHNGIDIAVAEGTPVLAAAAGRIDRASEDPLNGKYVVLISPRGLRTAYCHLSELTVTAGQSVAAGEELGRSGQTGRATGPHLHFGVWVHGRAVDPQRLALR